MKLNWLGRAAMNNSARASVQRWYVAHLLERLGGRVDGGRVLEVGCGGGAGVEILLDRLGAAEVHAFDLDPRMIAQARRRLARRPPGQVRLSLGDVTAIGAADATYDGVFDFGAIHLVPNWRAALDEVRRVLKAGGVYCFELVTSPLLRLAYPVVTEGFRRMQAPTPQEFVGELERRGIVVARSLARPRLAALTQLAGDLIGVGRVVNVIDCPVDSKKKSPGTSPGLSNQFPGDVLLSHEVYLEVPSGLEGLTAVFGMGTGVAPPLRSPGKPITSFRFSVFSFEPICSPFISELRTDH